MTQHTVVIAAAISPDPLAITAGDIVFWVNNTTDTQTVSSNDAGQTFTTGPIARGASSAPIAVRASTRYSVSPAGLQGSITINASQPSGNLAVNTGAIAVGFATDIKPMFTAMDQDHMLNRVGLFDLWNYGDVKTNAQQIYSAVSRGTMPPPGNGEPRWSSAKVDRFKQWMDVGFPP